MHFYFNNVMLMFMYVVKKIKAFTQKPDVIDLGD